MIHVLMLDIIMLEKRSSWMFNCRHIKVRLNSGHVHIKTQYGLYLTQRPLV